MAGWKQSALAACALIASGCAAQASQVGPLLSHRAVYELTLAGGSGPKAPAAAQGMIVFDIQGSTCEGWTTNFRQVTDVTPSEGATHRSDLSATSFEDGDGAGLRYRIATNEGRGERVVEGSAARSPGGLSIKLSKPVREKLDLGEEVVFPTAQVEGVLAAALAGKNTYEVKLFDGSDSGKKVYDTLSVIGPRRAGPDVGLAAEEPALKGHARWPVTTSYFDGAKGDYEPAYVLTYDLYDNGVTGRLKLDYGFFSLEGKLTQFKAYASKACK